MNPLQVLALTEALLSNWARIRVLMGDAFESKKDGLKTIADRLQSREQISETQLEGLLSQLQEHLVGTRASDYFMELRMRSLLPPRLYAERFGLPVFEFGMLNALQRAGVILGREISRSTVIRHVPVLFATNRTGTGEDGFSGEGNFEETGGVRIGMANISVPVDEDAVVDFERRSKWHPFGGVDASREVVLAQVDILDRGSFVPHLNAVKDEPSDTCLIFVHGYRVTFEEAALRAAQLANDLNLIGRIVLFSWPSTGSLFGYPTDEENAQASTRQFSAFVADLRTAVNSVHIMAHSMGCRVAVNGLGNFGSGKSAKKLGEVALLAPDVFTNQFNVEFPHFNSLCQGITLYASKGDLALRISRRLHRHERLGYVKGVPFSLAGLTTIDATGVDTSLLGHGYYTSKKAVLDDLKVLFHQSLPPDKRGLVPSSQKTYWKFPPGSH